MERHQKYEAIILKAVKFMDIHKNLHVLCDDGQIRNMTAYGALKSRNRIGGMTELFSAGIFHVYINPVKSSVKIEEVEPLISSSSLGRSLDYFYLFSFWAEIILHTSNFGGMGSDIYLLLKEILKAVSEGISMPKDRLNNFFLTVFLNQSGHFHPEDQCMECGRKLEDSEVLYFSSISFELKCHNCTLDDSLPLNGGIRKYLNNLIHSDLASAMRMDLSRDNNRRVKDFLLKFTSLVCDKPLRTLEQGLLF